MLFSPMFRNAVLNYTTELMGRKGGYITQQERDAAKKRNRKKKRK